MLDGKWARISCLRPATVVLDGWGDAKKKEKGERVGAVGDGGGEADYEVEFGDAFG